MFHTTLNSVGQAVMRRRFSYQRPVCEYKDRRTKLPVPGPEWARCSRARVAIAEGSDPIREEDVIRIDQMKIAKAAAEAT
jgi:hypothetical protein